MNPHALSLPRRIGEAQEIDYGKPLDADVGSLARDRIPVRSMAETDLRSIAAIDQKITGRARVAYLRQKLMEALHQSDVRVSLVAELDGFAVGFVMARVDLGEFGRAEPAAVMDTIGVDPDYRRQGVGRSLLSQLFLNLAALRVERIRTELDWRDRELFALLDACGFHPAQQLCFDLALV
jgi:ribosomal protein S18 acetylase RimI-like enzyme